jgi:hypothetical protein
MKCRILSLMLSLAVLSGCTSLISVSQTSIPAERKQPVAASATQWTLFGIAFSNDFVNEATDKLKPQCVGGKIEGILTKYDLKYFFPVYVRRVHVSGYCVEGGV